MTESITDAEIASLFSTDNKLLTRVLKMLFDNLVIAKDDIAIVKGDATVVKVMLADSLLVKSTEGGTEKLTIPADPFQIAGSAQECRGVLVVHSSDNAVYMNIGAVADADDFLIPKDVVIPVPIDNCSKLNFFGTADDTIRLLWRS